MRARFYPSATLRAGSPPTLGRFLSPDSIVPDPSDPQTLNRCSYVVNNPLRYTDPTGQYHSGQEWCAIHLNCDDSGGVDCDYWGCAGAPGHEHPTTTPSPGDSIADAYKVPIAIGVVAVSIPGPFDDAVLLTTAGAFALGVTCVLYCDAGFEAVGGLRCNLWFVSCSGGERTDADLVPAKDVRQPTSEELETITHRELERLKKGGAKDIGIHKETEEIVVEREGGGYTGTGEYVRDFE